jgi:hypothetical protein
VRARAQPPQHYPQSPTCLDTVPLPHNNTRMLFISSFLWWRGMQGVAKPKGASRRILGEPEEPAV